MLSHAAAETFEHQSFALFPAKLKRLLVERKNRRCAGLLCDNVELPTAAYNLSVLQFDYDVSVKSMELLVLRVLDSVMRFWINDS